jgi:squalene-hopene/tetraprenyl-beta-curcumene cyclase
VERRNLPKRVAEATSAATGYLYAKQRGDGGWTDRLSSSAMPTAIGLLALARADREAYGKQVETGLGWLRDSQRPDGGWGIADCDPPADASVTAFAVAALTALDPSGSKRCIDDGTKFIANCGGESAILPNIRTWRELVSIVWAMAGLRDAAEQPVQPIEVMLLPPRLRNRASIALPGVIGLGAWQSRVMRLSRPARIARRLAEPRGLAWLRAVQGPNGGMEECPLMAALVYLGLNMAGQSIGQDIQHGCLRYLLSTQRPDGSWAIDRDLEIAVTAYAVFALSEGADVTAEERLAATRDWLLSTQWKVPFDALRLPAGGWSWADPTGWPESEDTAVVLSALGVLGVPRQHTAIQAGLRWLLSRQNRNGSWSEWVRNSSMIHDGPCAGVTAHVITALRQFGVGQFGVGQFGVGQFGVGQFGVGQSRADQSRVDQSRAGGASRSPIERAFRYFEAEQEADGGISSLWFRDRTHGTAKVLETYAEFGRETRQVATRARQWLLASQRADGAWPATATEGSPDGGTAEETAWALYALLRGGLSPWDDQIVRGVDWLVAAQNGGGTWRPSAVGLYYDQMYYSDDLIAHTYALRALGRWRRCAELHPQPAG